MSDCVDETPDDRRQRYLRMAAEASRIANRSRRLEMREACLQMVQSWLRLAGDASNKTQSNGR
jgi:hypothetical protein